jgi:hypothetical protein
MSLQFWPCPGCSRHVKRGDGICPFCGATASIEISPRPTIAARLSRAALFAAGAVGTALATTNCGSMYGIAPLACPCEVEDSGASDGPSEVAADAADMSMSMTTMLTDSSSAADVPSAVAAYGAAVIIDE